MIKRRAAQAGVTGDFAGHSLRAGFATEAYAHGTPELTITRHGRWRSTSVMRGYVEQGGVERQRRSTTRLVGCGSFLRKILRTYTPGAVPGRGPSRGCVSGGGLHGPS